MTGAFGWPVFSAWRALKSCWISGCAAGLGVVNGWNRFIGWRRLGSPRDLAGTEGRGLAGTEDWGLTLLGAGTDTLALWRAAGRDLGAGRDIDVWPRCWNLALGWGSVASLRDRILL